MPEIDPESPGQSLGERQRLEEEYTRLVEPEVSGFMQEVLRLAVVGTLSLVAAMGLWRALTERVQARGGSQALTTRLEESDLPALATETALYYSGVAVSQGLGPGATDHLVRSSLGMSGDPLPGFRPGALTAEDGSEHDWGSSARGSARDAATEDHARDMLDLLRAEGYTHKRWYNRHDHLVRPTHVEADRQTILLEESFIVGGVALRWPGDRLAGAPQETARCRCVLAGVRW